MSYCLITGRPLNFQNIGIVVGFRYFEIRNNQWRTDETPAVGAYCRISNSGGGHSFGKSIGF